VKVPLSHSLTFQSVLMRPSL